MNHQVVQQSGATHSIHDPRFVDPLPAWLFDPQTLHARGLVTGSSVGRNSAWFFTCADTPMVLRHYWRGGIVARFARDVYVWTGRERTRPFREWRLMAELRRRGLPVPAPVAARAVRAGPGYRADLVTATIPGAAPLDERIHAGMAGTRTWHRVGVAIRQCHEAGAFHADLNVRNILLDDRDQPWLIDWDQGRLQRPNTGWQQANLDRLRRSIAKDPTVEAAAQGGWEALMDGYGRG
ncbi:3-deoxy-D-manno-octulosonic acid kinase [Aquisalimonas sp.]|uniref:3-deoxy-D-manno-octulosonic acid kinase n=1 Tax=Aquisalimonas sp. TaxID=1872621 RepID=UPI0025BE7C69|nr:3-deoxy-D-manno-octulosonic acid kinase [Aquisalimonas sp.]